MFSGVIDFSDVIYSFAIGSVGAIMFVLVDKYEPEGPVARILKFLVLFVSSVAIMHNAAIRAWAVLAGVSADASRVSHGPTPHHLREQERRERPFWALNRRHWPFKLAGQIKWYRALRIRA